MSRSDEINKLIDEAFDFFKVKPYTWQIQAVHDIAHAFLYEDKKNVILSADTGTGKSLIGAAVAYIMNRIKNRKSLILMSTNSLVDQYAETLDKYSAMYLTIKGADNYDCTLKEGLKASACSLPTINRLVKKQFNLLVEAGMYDSDDASTLKQVASEIVPNDCKVCVYKRLKVRARTIPVLITNFHWHFTKTIQGELPIGREVLVIDEAHTFNESAVDLLTVQLDTNLIETLIKNLDSINDIISFNLIESDEVKARAVTFETYQEILKEYNDILNYFEDVGITELRFNNVVTRIYVNMDRTLTFLESKDLEEELENPLTQLYKHFKKLNGIFGKFQSYLKAIDLTEFVFDRKDDTKVYLMKPIFIKDLSQKLLSDYNLFMSATITESYMIETLNLDQDATLFIQLPTVFPKENKPIHMIAKTSVSFETLKDPRTIKTLGEQVTNILDEHNNSKGIILIPSFKLGEDLYNKLKKHNRRIIMHRPDTKLSQLINEYKRRKDNCVLVSPSIYEGLDFKGDLSGFQILLKAPYPSLGDKRMAVIARRYPYLYKTMTLMKLVQGIGRSVRSATDYADTYVLDLAIESLLRSPYNVWKHTHKMMSYE